MMNSSHIMSILLILASIWSVVAQDNNFIITNYGGIGDGITDNNQAFQDAWKKACQTDGGTLSVPNGTFFVSGGVFEGPCIGQTLFRIDGTLVANSSSVGDFWLFFNKIDGLTICGSGTLDGNGASAWSRCRSSGNCDMRPDTLKMQNLKNVQIQDIHSVNSKMFHINFGNSQNVNVKNVTIIAPGDSPNTDGIHIGRSNYVTIVDSNIGTGDDCVSIGEGSRNVNISGVFCGPGHGFSIGSLGRFTGEGDVSGIMVNNCTLSKTKNGVRIKTWAPSLSSNVVSDVTFTNINLDSAGNPIIIDQYYCPHGLCAKVGESSVSIKRVKYINIRGTSSLATSVKIRCSKSMPCEDINFIGIGITFNGQPTMANCSYPNAIKFQGLGQVPSRCL